jgi:L,D-transpeptidase ErfK/SrfK
MGIRLSRRPGLSGRCAAGAVLIVFLALAALPVAAAEYAFNAEQQVVGGFGRYVAQDGDRFAEIARRFDIAYPELQAANPSVDGWQPGAGQQITLPTAFVLPDAPQKGIVVNLGQWRLFYFPPEGGRVETYPLGLGVIGKKTPIGVTRVVRKEPNPAWYPPASIRAEEPDLPAVVPPGPDNPLGAFALHLGWPNYLIHGTNKPYGVGRNVSHGCIRLYPEDIAKLFAAVPVGTPVRTVDQPATAGWYGNTLYVVVYPTKQQVYDLDVGHPIEPEPAAGVEAVVRAAAERVGARVSWEAVARVAAERTGIPVAVGVRNQPSTVAAIPPGAYSAAYSAAAPQADAGPPAYGSTALPPGVMPEGVETDPSDSPYDDGASSQ